jgi:glycerate kinase
MKVLVAPGAFKGSLKATDAADCIIHGLQRSGLDADLVRIPIADGGNGTLDVMLAATPSAERVTVTVRNPFGRPVKADYGLIDNGQTAIIEMALASGLEVLGREKPNAMKASTYGTGQLMAHALEAGARKFIIGLGGSATVEGGSGLVMALGGRLLDGNGKPILQQGGAMLDKVASVDLTALDPRWADTVVQVAVDVENPPFGDNGAAAIFGPQKGATEEQIPRLDAGIARIFDGAQ